MAIASGTRARICYVAESTHGTTPGTPSMKVLRTTSRKINVTKNMLETAEVRSDREITDVRHGFNRVEGELGFELSLAAYDDLIEAALGGTWATGTNVATIAAVASGNKFTRASGSWLTDGYRPGDVVLSAGFTTGANNGQCRVTAVTATDLTVTGLTLVDEAADASQSLNLVGKRVGVGTTLTTFTFERQFLDLTKYEVFTGVAVNAMSLTISPEEIVGGSFTLVGMAHGGVSGSPLDASPDAAPTYAPMAAFDGSIHEGGTAIATMTSLELSIEGGRDLTSVIGSATSPDVFDGKCKITGTATALFQDETLLNKFLNETESTIWVKLADPDDSSKFIAVSLYRVKYTGGEIDPPQEGPILLSLPFEALYNSTYGARIGVQRSNS